MLSPDLLDALRPAEQRARRLVYKAPSPRPSSFKEEELSEDITRKKLRLDTFQAYRSGEVESAYELHESKAVELVNGDSNEARRRFESDKETAIRFEQGVELDPKEHSYWSQYWPVFTPTLDNPSTLYLPDLIQQTEYEITQLRRQQVIERMHQWDLVSEQNVKDNEIFLDGLLGK